MASFALPTFSPPNFFEIVEENVFQTNKFDSISFAFVSNLQLRTIVYLSSDEFTQDLNGFLKEREVNLIYLGLKHQTISPWKSMTESMAKEAIEYILDERLHPVMIMCKTGVHLSGTVIGCLRRLQNWSLTAIIDNYRNLASSVTTRFENEQFIELFDVDLITLPSNLPAWFEDNQKLMESERQTLLRGEYYPGSESHQSAEKDAPAYQRFYFKTIGPLVSASVKYSEKKSIIGDDDDD